MTALKYAIILSGAGNRDGSEIHEAVSALLAISKTGGQYSCFASDIDFAEVNFLTGELTGLKRNVLEESARIARGNIEKLTLLNEKDFDVLVLPGGLGAIKNLCNFAYKGIECEVLPEVAQAITAFHKAGKPIVALCIAPILLAKLINGAKITLGDDENVSDAAKEMGARIEYTTDPRAVVIDAENKLISTPCYMLADNVADVAEGVQKAIEVASQC